VNQCPEKYLKGLHPKYFELLRPERMQTRIINMRLTKFTNKKEKNFLLDYVVIPLGMELIETMHEATTPCASCMWRVVRDLLGILIA